MILLTTLLYISNVPNASAQVRTINLKTTIALTKFIVQLLVSPTALCQHFLFIKTKRRYYFFIFVLH